MIPDLEVLCIAAEGLTALGIEELVTKLNRRMFWIDMLSQSKQSSVMPCVGISFGVESIIYDQGEGENVHNPCQRNGVPLQKQIKSKPGQQFDAADKIGAPVTIIQVQEEYEQGMVKVKALGLERIQTRAKTFKLVDYVRKLLLTLN
ncbi:uncharacterized protein V1513DRAFT_427895 [Lipomyces chichibuensis]|uniref:uncharacterized protein n=1 Tax=Lipomyces chichibuensis TaxID=1546026 RepID=UPI003343C0D1